MYMKMREPVSGLTHLFGAILSLIGIIILIITCTENNMYSNIFALVIFGISLVGLYSASCVYHLVNISKKAIKILQRIDHCMIYVLIAGTYTPICLISLKGKTGIILLIIIWGMAIAGIALKILWFNAPRWLYTLFYVVMGWAAVFAIAPLSKVLPALAMFYLFAGGVAYTIGAVFYALKKPIFKNNIFGFHEIFHIFVLLGSAFHFALMFQYVLYL